MSFAYLGKMHAAFCKKQQRGIYRIYHKGGRMAYDEYISAVYVALKALQGKL
ncbi:hypothetical protein [Helicobacter jaachi]|uniref:hypothetical protein n=1 Tax=Helicobacter jaachi TaxID=1677920 RepID=UPI000AD7D4B2|nr:hypothetical protein [Helicobacter jaachi]